MATCFFTAQEVYDLREATGFISGIDLHELFVELVGEPSPSGYTPVEVDPEHWLIQTAQELAPELEEAVRSYFGYGTDEHEIVAMVARATVCIRLMTEESSIPAV